MKARRESNLGKVVGAGLSVNMQAGQWRGVGKEGDVTSTCLDLGREQRAGLFVCRAGSN